jgi:hypothetical protein
VSLIVQQLFSTDCNPKYCAHNCTNSTTYCIAVIIAVSAAIDSADGTSIQITNADAD